MSIDNQECSTTFKLVSRCPLSVMPVSSKVGFNENVCYILNASLIWLIPKIVVALDIKDFRPTSLVGSVASSNDTSLFPHYRWKVKVAGSKLVN